MGEAVFSCAFACCFFLVLPTVIMQGIGCFSTKLVFTDECGDIGLNTECCFNHCNASSSDYIGPRRLSDVANGLHITAFSVFLFFALFVMWLTCCNCREEYEPNSCVYCFGCLSILFIPIAGIFCVAGSIVVQYAGDRPDNSTLGAAFYLSLVTGLYVIIVIASMICCGCCLFSKPDGVAPITSSRGYINTDSNMSVENPNIYHTNVVPEPVPSQRSQVKTTDALANVQSPMKSRNNLPAVGYHTQRKFSHVNKHQAGTGGNRTLAIGYTPQSESPVNYSSGQSMSVRENSEEYSYRSDSSEDVIDNTYATGFSEQTGEQSSSQRHYVGRTEASGFRAQAHETGTDVVAARVVDQEEIHEVDGLQIFRKIRTTIITSIREKFS